MASYAGGMDTTDTPRLSTADSAYVLDWWPAGDMSAKHGSQRLQREYPISSQSDVPDRGSPAVRIGPRTAPQAGTPRRVGHANIGALPGSW